MPADPQQAELYARLQRWGKLDSNQLTLQECHALKELVRQGLAVEEHINGRAFYLAPLYE